MTFWEWWVVGLTAYIVTVLFILGFLWIATKDD